MVARPKTPPKHSSDDAESESSIDRPKPWMASLLRQQPAILIVFVVLFLIWLSVLAFLAFSR